MSSKAVTSSGKLLTAALFLVLIFAGQGLAYTQGDPEFRTFWVDAWHAGFLNSSQVVTLLGTPGTTSGGEIRAANCNAVIVEVRREADVCYPSGMGEPYFTSGDYNALQAIINAAHDTTGGKKRIEVHAWFVTFGTGGGAVYAAHDDPGDPANYWCTENYDGTRKTDFDPGHPRCLDYTANVFMDVVNNFDVDGIHYDYIRFTATDNGYNPTSLSRYLTKYGGAKPLPTDATFKQWRRDQISHLVRQVYARVQAVKPHVVVSGSFYTGAPAPSSSSHAAFESTQPYKDWYSDWDQWMQDGYIDMSVLMAYFDDDVYRSTYLGWKNFAADRRLRGSAVDRHAIVGPGIYMNYLDDAITQLKDTRDASPSGNYLNGMCGFSYARPYLTAKDPDVFGTWANFRPQYVSQVCNSMVDVPARPWKTAPTKAHISGRVRIGSSSGAWADGATVSITGPESRSQTCDGTGFYAFIDLTPGTYTMTVSYTGYTNQTRSQAIAVGAVTGNMYVENFVFGCTPPVISNVQATPLTGNSELITWTTNVPATSQVRYGLTTAYGGLTPVDTNLVTSHAVTLTGGILPNRLYHYYPISALAEEEGGCSAQTADMTFTTCGGVPAISNVQVTDITGTTAVVSWTTNVPADSRVDYGLTSSYGSVASNGTMVTSHSIPLSGLSTYETYHYKVTSNTGCGDASSTDLVFATSDMPIMTSVTDGTYTTSTSQIVASWSATPGISPIARYEYAVGTTSGGTDLRGWTDAGMTVPYTISGLSLSVGSTYYVSARAVNTLEIASAPMSSAGVTVVQAATSVHNAKSKANGEFIGLPVRVVSARWPDFFYIEDPDRSSGIRVQLASSLVVDREVTVFGTMGLTSENERALLDPFVIEGSPGTPIQPLIVIGKAVGGCDMNLSGVVTPGVSNAMGLNNVGLLVKIAGRVTKGVADGFYLNDGVGPTDETGWAGIKIWTGSSGAPYENTWQMVTGIISMRKPGATVPMILAREILAY